MSASPTNLGATFPPIPKPHRSSSISSTILTNISNTNSNAADTSMRPPAPVRTSSITSQQQLHNHPNLHIRTASYESLGDARSNTVSTPRSLPTPKQSASHTHTPRTAGAQHSHTSSTLSHTALTSHNHPMTHPPELPSPTSPTSRRSNALLAKLKQQMRESAAAIEHSTAAVLHTADTHLRGIEPVKSTVEDAMLETLDYDMNDNNDQNNDETDVMQNSANNAFSSTMHVKHTPPNGIILFLLQLFVTMLIAFITAIAMYIVSNIIAFFVGARVSIVMQLLEVDRNDAAAYFAKIGISIAYCLVSGLMVAILAADARGSGVPFCMAYLNGTNVNQFFKLRIVAVKILSLAFTIASGLTLGKEGPFVHIGAGIAYVLSQSLHWIDVVTFGHGAKYTKQLRTISEERIFMAGGMAAGLTVAFAAPIAGILFALEGSTSFITVPVLIRIFGCAMFASFFNDWSKSGWGNAILNHNLINKTRDESLQPYAWQFQEIFVYLWLAVLCGSFAAVVTRLNVVLTKYRHHHMHNDTWRGIGKNVGEVCFWTFLTATLWFVIPYWFSCRPLIAACSEASTEVVMCRQAHCATGYWTELGSIVYATPDGIARLMLDRSIPLADDYHTGPLMLYAIVYFLLVGCQYGIYTPGGLFVPAVVAGAVIGRVHGIWLSTIFPSWGINTGVYGMLGAAAMLGGFNRLVLPIVLMVIEMTGDSTYLLPIMICGSVAKMFADWLEPPLYPQHMQLEGIPQLTDKLNPVIAKLQAHHIMKPASQIPTLQAVEQVETITGILQSSQRVIFPVLNKDGQLVGTVTRRAVLYAVQYTNTYASVSEAEKCGHVDMTDADTKMQDWHDTQDYAGTLNTISDITQLDTTSHYLNLKPFVDTGAVTAHGSTPTKRIAGVFRRVGVSHLCVTDHRNIFLGIITRRNLVSIPTGAVEALMSVRHGKAAGSSGQKGGENTCDVVLASVVEGGEDDFEETMMERQVSDETVYDDNSGSDGGEQKSARSTPRRRMTPKKNGEYNVFDHV